MSKMPLHEEGVPLQEWANANEPGTDMVWYRGYWNQVVFVRDELHRHFVATYTESLENPVRVVGTHTSKSIKLPVYSIKTEGLEVRIRYNFYNWKVSIRSDVPVPDVFYQIIEKDETISSVYFEGFEKDWIFGSYNDNPYEFSVEIGNEYDLYAFFLIVTSALRQK